MNIKQFLDRVVTQTHSQEAFALCIERQDYPTFKKRNTWARTGAPYVVCKPRYESRGTKREPLALAIRTGG